MTLFNTPSRPLRLALPLLALICFSVSPLLANPGLNLKPKKASSQSKKTRTQSKKTRTQPKKTSPRAESKPTVKSENTSAPSDQGIDINTASVAELMQLKGIGKKRAEMIVKDREENGPYQSPSELTRVKGIGPKTVAKNTSRLRVKPRRAKTLKAKEGLMRPRIKGSKLTPKTSR